MSEMLPLFPLSTVLFPGMVLPLHVFEQRYRQLVQDLLAQPEPRELGVIAIRTGREVGPDGAQTLYDIGCVATVRETSDRPDGRYDLVTAGTRRFRLLRVDRSLEYLRGEVEPLAEDVRTSEAQPDAGPPEPEAEADQRRAQAGPAAAVPGAAQAVRGVQAAFRSYLNVLADRSGALVRVADIPDEPLLLSYVVAAAMIIDLPERQGLLAQPDALARLRAERALLTREAAMLRTTTSRPAPDFTHTPHSNN